MQHRTNAYHGRDVHAHSADMRARLADIRALLPHAPLDDTAWLALLDTLYALFSEPAPHQDARVRHTLEHLDALRVAHQNLDADLDQVDACALLLLAWQLVAQDLARVPLLSETLLEIGKTCTQGASHRLLALICALL